MSRQPPEVGHGGGPWSRFGKTKFLVQTVLNVLKGGKSSKAIMWEYKSQKSCDHYHDVYNEAFVACIHRIAVEKDVTIT